MIKRVFSLHQARKYGLDEGGVSTAVDTESNTIVAYVEGQTLSRIALVRLAEDMNCYRVYYDLDSAGSCSVHGFAIDLHSLFIALGLGCSYEEEWGDYRAVLELLRKDPEKVQVTQVLTIDVEESVIREAIRRCDTDPSKSET